MSLFRKNRKRFSSSERRTTVVTFVRRLARALLQIFIALTGGALLVFTATEVYRWALASPALSLQSISTRGLRHVSESEIVKLCGLKLGQNMFRLNMTNVERALSSHPWVKTAEARRRFPSSVAISVQEHVPAALALLGDLYLIDEDGTPFKKLQANDDLDLPVITGLTREQYVAAPDEGAARFRQAIQTGRMYVRFTHSNESLSEVRLEGESLTLVVGEGQEIRLSDSPTDQVFEKLNRVRSELDRRGLSAEVVHLENRVRPGWITVKLAPALSERRGER